MNYIIKLMDGAKYTISAEEYQKLNGKEGLVYIPSSGVTVNLNSVTAIISQDQYDKEAREVRARSSRGILHTAERGIRYFGEWYLDNGVFLDDPKTGLPTRPEKRLDPTYYPEVARDCVPTPEEFERKYAMLSPEERLKAIMEPYSDRQKLGEGFKKVGEFLSDKKKMI